MKPHGKNWAGSPAALLFVLVLCCSAYFYQGGGWNQNSRFDLVRSIVELSTVRIDAFHENTGDKALIRNHYYSDKAPGTSFWGVPVHAAVHTGFRRFGRERCPVAVTSYITTVWSAGVPSALAAVLVYGLFLAFGHPTRRSTGFAAAYALGTPALPYSTLLYGHQLAAFCLTAGLYMAFRIRKNGGTETIPMLALLGFILGWSVLVEYPSAAPAVMVTLYAAWHLDNRRRLIWVMAGASIPVLLLLTYQWTVFGHPLALTYRFTAHEHAQTGFIREWGMPSLEALRGILISPRRGLLYYAPWLVFALPGSAFLLANRDRRHETTVCLLICAWYVWLNGSMIHWMGGRALGPRYLVPMLPFAALMAGGIFLPPRSRASGSFRRTVAAMVAVAAIGSICLMVIGTAVLPEVSGHFADPLRQVLIPAFIRGDLSLNTQSFDSATYDPAGARSAWNLGHQMGLNGLGSLLPLLGFVLLTGIGIYRLTNGVDPRTIQTR
ncbi:hypothetical protein JXA40_10845 [bacterium]|nr:hypothetical protein [candidate division CSSED10-310 bacterium]